MTRQTHPHPLRASAAAVALAAVITACGGSQGTTLSGSVKVARPPSGAGLLAGGFTNSVPETPWWRVARVVPRTAHSKKAPPQKPVVIRWTLSGDILFNTGSAQLSAAAESQLSSVVTDDRLHPGAHVSVIGFTDSVPDPAAGGNLALSRARAKAVAAYLVSAGLTASLVTTEGYGSSDPVASNATAAGRAQNRRVTIVLCT